MESLLCNNDETLPSCSSFSCGEGSQANYLEDELTLPSAQESTEENELTLPSAADTLSFDLDDDHIDLQLSDAHNIELAPEVQAGPLLTSTPRKLRKVHPRCHQDDHDPLPPDHSQLEYSCNATDDYTTGWQLTNVMNFNGCGDMCAIKMHGLTNHDVLRAHCCFENKTQRDQNDWILKYFSEHCPYNSNGEKDFKNVAFMIQGKSICVKLWQEILSVSSSRFYRLRQDFIQFGGITSVTKRQRSLSSKTLEAMTWMEDYFQRVGDKRPDKADSIYLPTCLTEKKLFDIFVDDLYSGELSLAISRSQFNNIFRKDFKHVSIPKQCRFTKCDFCTLVKIETVKPTTSKEEKENLKKLLEDHIKLQEQERQRYYANRRQAIENPNECISLIADGMDQNKTNVPSLVRTAKSCQNLWNLRTHLTGVLVHGSGSHCYFDCLQWPHDCNLTLTSILNALSEVSQHRTLPPKLLIQMDNCVRENKNKYVYGFLLLLVELDIFTEIELGFLMVGHTHEDVDQSFSLLSRYLHKNSAVSMEEMMKATRASNQNVTNVSLVEYIFNIREWISPHLDTIKYHTEPHIFKFKKNRFGKAAMYYKQWSHCNWEPDNDGCLLLKSVPTGRPNLVMPSLDKQDVPRLQKDLKKYEAAGVLSEQAKKDWDLFMPKLESYASLSERSPLWLIDEIPTVQLRCARSFREFVVPEHIMEHVQSSKEFRKIIIGDKKKSGSSDNADSRVSKKARKEPVNEEPTVGSYITLKCNKYKEWTPQIGQVQSIDESKVTINWLDGTYTSTWIFWKYRGKPVCEAFPRRAIIKIIQFTPSMRLRRCDIDLIKKDYSDVEYV